MTKFSIAFTLPWLLLLLIPAAIFTFLPYFRSNKKYRRNRNRIISLVLHCTIMVLCISLLAGISFNYEKRNNQNEILLLVDSSYSNSEHGQQTDDFVQEVVNICGKDYKLGIVKFGYDQKYVAELSYDAQEVYKQYLQSDDPDITATDYASALKFASNLFSEKHSAKIVVISDGLETDNKAAAVIKSVAAEGVKVDAVCFSSEKFEEVQIADVVTPDYNISVGQKFSVGLKLKHNITDGKVFVTVYDNGVAKEPVEYVVNKDTQSLDVQHSFDLPGMHQLKFEIASDFDKLEQNNVYYSYINVADSRNILVVEKYQGEGDRLKAILDEDSKNNVTQLNITDVPNKLESLCMYEEVIFVNIANGDLPAGFDQLLYDYVHVAGGGLFTVGGNEQSSNAEIIPHTYVYDDMNNSGSTLYSQMLPVQVLNNYTPPIAVVIVIDHSGSMGSGPDSAVEKAKRGALDCLDALSARDYCGIITLDSSTEEKIKVTPVSQRETIRQAINNIPSDGQGGTIFANAIRNAGSALTPLDVERKHIIIVSDGDFGDVNYDAFGDNIKTNFENGITMSIVGYKPPQDKLSDLQKAADEGGGKFYDISDSRLGELASIMTEDLRANAISTINYGEEFVPAIRDHTSVVEGIDPKDMPSLTGYYGTKKKEGADQPLVGKYVPIYAQWKFGEGSVGSFMCDLNGTWSANFLESETGKKIINNVISSLLPIKDIKQHDISVTFRNDNYLSQMNVYTELAEDDTVEVKVTPYSEEAKNHYGTQQIPVTPSDGYTRFGIEITYPGMYKIVVTKKDSEQNVLSTLELYKTFSYSKEYDVFPEREQTSEEFLAGIAQDGNGKVVKEAYEILDSFQKSTRISYDPRLPFLITAIVLFLLDIAVRKFKFKWIHEIIRDHKEKKALKKD